MQDLIYLLRKEENKEKRKKKKKPLSHSWSRAAVRKPTRKPIMAKLAKWQTGNNHWIELHDSHNIIILQLLCFLLKTLLTKLMALRLRA